jgi:putative membrane protein
MMKNLVKNFLSDQEREKIIAAVQEVEKGTSGEIVPMVVPWSYHYPTATLIGSLAVSLLLAIAATLGLSFYRLWGTPGSLDIWAFPAVFGVIFLIAQIILRRTPLLKRPFITAAEMNEEVEEAALTSFYRKGLNRTRDQTGVLVFISVYERRAWVLADQGINEKVPSDTWQEVVEHLVQGIREKRQGEAICEAVKRCGELLQDHFPIKKDDTDELDNLIVEE